MGHVSYVPAQVLWHLDQCPPSNQLYQPCHWRVGQMTSVQPAARAKAACQKPIIRASGFQADKVAGLSKAMTFSKPKLAKNA